MPVQKVSSLASEPSIIITIQVRDYKGLCDEQKNNDCLLHIMKPFKYMQEVGWSPPQKKKSYNCRIKPLSTFKLVLRSYW